MLTDGDDYREELKSSFHKTIKKVSEDIESLKFNTAIAALMSLINEIYATKQINKAELKTFITLLNPFAPHMTEELYEDVGYAGMLNEQKWPEFDEALCVDDTIEIVAQINGKVKAKLVISVDESKEDVIAKVKSESKIKEAIDGRNIVKEIYVPGKLVNIVVK